MCPSFISNEVNRTGNASFSHSAITCHNFFCTCSLKHIFGEYVALVLFATQYIEETFRLLNLQ